jgi:acetyl-CoA carboxylase biotin carboxyl carrier protein
MTEHVVAPTPEGQRLAVLRQEALALIAGAPAACSRLRVAVGDCVVEMAWEQPAVLPPAGSPVPTVVSESVTVTSNVAAPTPADETRAVTSPMVGTFYRSPEPSARPFVEVGDRVEVGDPVGIVEAMKLMNRILTDVAGVVASVEVADADGVEFGQPLVRIKPDEG